MLSSYISELPDNQEEFDVLVRRFFTDKYTKIMKEQSDVYHYMNPHKTMTKYVHAVKTEFRQFSRPLRGIGAIHFGYR